MAFLARACLWPRRFPSQEGLSFPLLATWKQERERDGRKERWMSEGGPPEEEEEEESKRGPVARREALLPQGKGSGLLLSLAPECPGPGSWGSEGGLEWGRGLALGCGLGPENPPPPPPPEGGGPGRGRAGGPWAWRRNQGPAGSDAAPPVMSAADHEKELQRPRGAEGGGGLEGLAGPGARDLGSPEKKKPRRTSAAQVPPFPPSEYAPPPNPSADHLIAANPFDDNYQHAALPCKTLPSGSPYFASPPSYGSFGGFNAFRMPPHLLPRMVPSAVYGAAFPFRNQAHPFPQNPVGMVFSHPQAAMNFGTHENVGFGNQPSYNANVGQSVGFPSQHFRPNPGENFGHIPSQNTTQATPHHELPVHFGPGGNHNNPPHFNSSQVEANHSYGPLPNRYNQAKPLQQKQGATKPGATPQPQQQHHPPQGPEDIVSSGNTDVKTLNRSTPTSQDNIPSKNMENLNSNHANGTQAKPRLPRGVAEGGGKMPLRPSHHDPLYPCGICTHEVNDDQDAILCEASCQKWFHRICTGMTESAYGLLTAEASAVWGCDACMANKDVQLMCTREMTGPPALNTDA